MRRQIAVVALAFSVVGIEARGTAADELHRAESVLLESASASERLQALLTVLRHGSGDVVLPADLERLMVRATADPSREVAGLAERALLLRQSPPESKGGAEEERRLRRAGTELREIEAVLTRWQDGPSTDRAARAAVRRLANHGAESRAWSHEVEWLVDRARRHSDPEVARVAERLLAKRDGRRVEPDPEAAAARRAEDELILALARSRNSDTRLAALHRLVDRVQGEDRDPWLLRRVRDRMLAARDDPDPRVGAFATWMLAGLAGDQAAMRAVYVGAAPP